MFFLTSHERKILLFIGILILAGSFLKFFDLGPRDTPVEVTKPSSLININTASQKELESISGIGPVTAFRIIEYRKSLGFFKELEDLKQIKGIGNKKLKDIKGQIIFN